MHSFRADETQHRLAVQRQAQVRPHHRKIERALNQLGELGILPQIGAVEEGTGQEAGTSDLISLTLRKYPEQCTLDKGGANTDAHSTFSDMLPPVAWPLPSFDPALIHSTRLRTGYRHPACSSPEPSTTTTPRPTTRDSSHAGVRRLGDAGTGAVLKWELEGEFDQLHIQWNPETIAMLRTAVGQVIGGRGTGSGSGTRAKGGGATFSKPQDDCKGMDQHLVEEAPDQLQPDVPRLQTAIKVRLTVKALSVSLNKEQVRGIDIGTASKGRSQFGVPYFCRNCALWR